MNYEYVRGIRIPRPKPFALANQREYTPHEVTSASFEPMRRRASAVAELLPKSHSRDEAIINAFIFIRENLTDALVESDFIMREMRNLVNEANRPVESEFGFSDAEAEEAKQLGASIVTELERLIDRINGLSTEVDAIAQTSRTVLDAIPKSIPPQVYHETY